MSFQQETDEVIGDNLRRFRNAAGISQAQLAQALESDGYSMQYQTIQKIERGTRPLKLAEAIAISRLLHTSLLSLTLRAATPDQKQLLMALEILHTRIREARAERIEAEVNRDQSEDAIRDSSQRLEYLEGELQRVEGQLAKMQEATDGQHSEAP